MKHEQIKVRTTETTKSEFRKKLFENGHYMTGVILLFIDTYIKRPKQTMEALKRIKES